MDAADESRFVDSAVASVRGDEIVADPEEVWLSRFRDATLLVLAVVTHAHGISTKQIRHATGQRRLAVRRSLRSLQRAELIEHQRRPGEDHWYATREGTRLGVVPYVTRLFASIVPLWKGHPGAGWSVGAFQAVGTEHGPPIFRPSVALAGMNDPDALAKVIRTGLQGDRAFAVTKLIALNDPSSVAILCEVAQRRDEDEPLARQAVVALGHFDLPASIETLIDAAGRRDSLIRESAARSLGQLHAARSVPTLEGLLSYRVEQVRAAAAVALGRIGLPSASTALATVLADSDGGVRHAARHALIQLGEAGELKSNRNRPWPLRFVDAARARRNAP